MRRKRQQEQPKRRWITTEEPNVPGNPIYADLCSRSLHSWTCGADPNDVADWLLSQQSRCPVALGDMVFALRGLKPFRHDAALAVAVGVAIQPATLASVSEIRGGVTTSNSLVVEDAPGVEDADPSLAKLDEDIKGWDLFA